MKFRTILSLLAGCWLLGIGSKFIAGYMLGYSMPSIPMLDLFFDWIPAAFFGATLIITALKTVVQDARVRLALKSPIEGITTKPPRTSQLGPAIHGDNDG